ncbi:MAG: hypothetical protein U1E36_04580 [Rickettsiales bacterium]
MRWHTTAFVCLIGIEIPREFLSVAPALEILAIAVINLRFDIHALRWPGTGRRRTLRNYFDAVQYCCRASHFTV